MLGEFSEETQDSPNETCMLAQGIGTFELNVAQKMAGARIFWQAFVAMFPSTLDPHNLNRFVEAQQSVYGQALAEIRAGRKRSHWMWYIFPQLAGLGFSAMSQRYAIRSLGEAREYLRHMVLGPRLIECCEALLRLQRLSAHEIFGTPDDLKLKSSATLFAMACEPGSVFEQLLEKYFEGERDDKTLGLLETAADKGDRGGRNP